VSAQTNRFLRKAARSTENGYLEKAKGYYLKILSTDKEEITLPACKKHY